MTTRESLLEKGYELFHNKGYNATGIQEITDAVQVSKGSFYNHFKKKEKFAAELIENFGKQLAKEHMEALSDKKWPPLLRIQKFYLKKIEDVIHKEQFQKGCLVANMCQEIADHSELIARSVDYAFNGMHAALSYCLTEAKLNGELANNTNVELLAEFILNSWNGALMRVKASKSTKALDAFMNFLNYLLG